MVMNPEEFYAHAMLATDGDGRLPLARMAGWEVFPFEPDGLRVVPLATPELPEPPRLGESGRACPACSTDRAPVWSDQRWRLSPLGESGVPLILWVASVGRFDLAVVPDDHAADLDLLTVRIARAIEALPHIA